MRQLAEESLREAEMHDSRVQAYDVVLSDLPMVRSSVAQQLTLEIPEDVDADNGEEDHDGSASNLAEHVREALPGLRDREFGTADLRQYVEQKVPGFLATLEPKALTKTLWRLAAVGEIEKIQAGGGGRLAVYRVPRKGSNRS